MYNPVKSGLPGLLADSLPDEFGNSLIRRYMESEQIDLRQITPLDRLAYVGVRGMGALTFTAALFAEAGAKYGLNRDMDWGPIASWADG